MEVLHGFVSLVERVLPLLSSLFGGCKEKIVEIRDPALVQELERIQELRRSLLDRTAAQDSAWKVEKGDMEVQLREQQRMEEERNQRSRVQFERVVATAIAILRRATFAVHVLLGAEGSGKSTVALKLYDINDAVPGTGSTHVTREIQAFPREGNHLPLVDTIGRATNLKGLARLLACLFFRGMDPKGLVVVHNGRLEDVVRRLTLVGASGINSISFEPRSFWMAESRQPGANITDFIFTEPAFDAQGLQQVSNAETPMVDSGIRTTLLSALTALDFELFKRSEEYLEIPLGMLYLLASAIAERAEFVGDDFLFVNQLS